MIFSQRRSERRDDMCFCVVVQTLSDSFCQISHGLNRAVWWFEVFSRKGAVNAEVTCTCNSQRQ
jgi:hypothetical protein